MNESVGFWFVVIIVVCMAWIWRKLKDIETHLKERDLEQDKHNKSAELNNYEICKMLKMMNIHELPDFLRKDTLKIWGTL